MAFTAVDSLTCRLRWAYEWKDAPIVIIDAHSKWIEAFATTTSTSTTVIEILRHVAICSFWIARNDRQ